VSITVCSGFSPQGRLQYGERFLRTFHQFWPASVSLAVYVEQSDAALDRLGQGAIRSLWDCEGMRAFLTRHEPDPVKNGRAPHPGWKSKDHRAGYSFKFDAVKFSRQCFIPEQAALACADGDILVWLDADVVSFKPVPDGFVEGLLGEADGCYLGREYKHSEIGFWAVRLSPRTRAFLAMLAGTYRSDDIFKLGEWHSAYAWDYCRKIAESAGAKFKNLTPGGHDHVWVTSPLFKCLDHMKGEARKAAGMSAERRYVR